MKLNDKLAIALALPSLLLIEAATAHPMQVEAIMQESAYSPTSVTYFWSENSASQLEQNSPFSSPVSVELTGSEWKSRGWPEGRSVKAIYLNPTLENVMCFFWDNGTYSDYNLATQRFSTAISLSQAGSFWQHAGWPADKSVVAIFQNPTSNDQIMYFWSDDTYSEFNKTTRSFSGPYPILQSRSFWTSAGWPAGKSVKAIAQNPTNSNYISYFWNDGTYSEFDLSQHQFHGPFAISQAGSYWQARGWPEATPTNLSVTHIDKFGAPSGLHVKHSFSGDTSNINLNTIYAVSNSGERITPSGAQRISSTGAILVTFPTHYSNTYVTTYFEQNQSGTVYSIASPTYRLPYFNDDGWH